MCASPVHAPSARDADDVDRTWGRHLSSGRASLGQMFGGHVEADSHGAELFTTSGERYLNCSGYGVFLLGATHPTVTEAVIDQVRRHPLSTRILLDGAGPRAAQALAEITPPGLDKVHFVGSGTEAVETAIKLGRVHGHTRLVSAVQGYHGKTMGALTLTSKPVYRDPFVPLLPDAVAVPYGDVEALERVLADGPPSMFVVEPIQGEAGVIIPPDGYLKDVHRVCRDHGCLLVVDEVLTGLGRTGPWFAVDTAGVVPDVLLVGKALSGGVVPVAAAVTTGDLYRPFDKDPFLHTSTFSGAPIAMAAAAASIKALHEENVVERATDLGRTLLDRLRAAAAAAPGLVTDVRGRGLLIGVEFADPGLTGEAMLELLSRRVLVNHSLNNSHVLRLTPPVVLDHTQLEELCAAFDSTFVELARRFPRAVR